MSNQRCKGHGIATCMSMIQKISIFLVFFITLSSTNAFSQNRTISGMVRNAQNEPLSGITVTVKGTNTATSTNDLGQYSIATSRANPVLVFSGVGVKRTEMPVQGRTQINVQLEISTSQLENVVVVAYGTQKKGTVSGSVAAVDGDEILKSPATNVSNSLAGRLPGLVALGQSGEPGSDFSTLLVRGLSTIGNNAPLVVVDGVPNRSLERIDPNTIESISVVKDASAAIYGSQAANGLILVTTKRGKTGRVSVNASFNQGFSRPTRIPDLTNSYEFAQLVNEIDAHRSNPLTYSPEKIEMFRTNSDPWRAPNTDWFDAVLKDWSGQNAANVSLSGGTDMARIFVSLTSRYQDGYYKKSASKYRQHDLRANFDSKINEYISASIDFSGRLEDRDFPTRGSGKLFNEMTGSRPDLPAYWPNGLPGPPLDMTEQSNPVVTSTFAGGYNRSNTYVMNLNGKLTIKIPGVEGLSVTGTAGIDRNFIYGKQLLTPYMLNTWDGFTVDANDIPVLTERQFGPGNIALYQNADQFKGYLLNGVVNYEKKLFTDHSIKLLAGVERFQNQFSYLTASRTGLLGAYPDELNFGDGETQLNSGSTPGKDRWQHYFGRVNYDFKGKYIAEFVWRYQGSSKFSEQTRTAFFPGISVAYRLSEEEFWKNNIGFINSFKLRASWGKTGNDLIQPYQFLSTYGIGGQNFVSLDPGGSIVNNNYLFETRVPNFNAQWEEALQRNIGVDMTLIENKLSVTADYFNYRRSKILIPETASIPGTTGFPSLPDVNKGIVSNKGFDFQVLYRGNVGKLTFQAGLNGGFAKSKTIFFDEAEGIPDYQKTTGHPLFTGNYYRNIFYRAMGIFNDAADVDKYAHIDGAVPGDVIFEDVNGDGEINAKDKVTIDKNHVPTFNGGFTLAMQFKGFDLSMLVQGASGGIRYLLGRGSKEGNFLKSFYDQRWTPDNPDSEFPRTFNRNDEYWMSSENLNTFWIRKTDFLRLKNIELGYTFPGFYQKVGIQGIRIYVNAFNLLTYSPDYKDFDPELEPKADGFAGQGYPLQKIVNAGISVQF